MLLALGPVLLGASAASAAPVITLEAQAAVVSGLPAGGRVALVAVAREPRDYTSLTRVERAELVDDDQDGTVRWTLAEPLPGKALVLAVDLATAELALATPPDFPLGAEPLLEEPWLVSASGDVAGWQLPASRVVTLLVRPGAGAWFAEHDERASNDPEAVVNGDVEMAWAGLAPLALETGSPSTLANADLLVGVAPESFSVWLARASSPSQVQPVELGGAQ